MKKKGFDGVLITDHESIEGFKSLKNIPEDFVVLCGFEYTTVEGELLVILPKHEVIKWNKEMKAMELIKLVHKKGGVIGIAHMFRDKVSIGNNINKHQDIEDIVNAVDFVEIENGKNSEENDLNALWWAEECNKPQTKGSDSHDDFGVGIVGTEFLCDIKDERDLIKAIRKGKMKKTLLKERLS